MNLGPERKKIYILAGLLLVALVVFLTNSDSGSGNPASTGTRPGAAPTALRPGMAAEPASRPRRSNLRQSIEFRPSLLKKRGEALTDPTTIDPTLRLDVLANLQKIKVEGTRRSIFDFGQAPPPAPDAIKVAAAKAKIPSPLVPAQAPTPANTDPVKPQAPPVPLKFYGFISPVNAPLKRAFFMDGDEIHVATEGDLIKRRYKIVRIGINSAVVEDTQFGSQQTLPLEEQPG